MRLPEDAGGAALLRLLGLEVERPVPAPRVDAHHADAAVEQPAHGLGGDAAAARDVVGGTEERVTPCMNEDDVAWLEIVSGLPERVLRLLRGDRVAVLLVREVEADAGRVEEVE